MSGVVSLIGLVSLDRPLVTREVVSVVICCDDLDFIVLDKFSLFMVEATIVEVSIILLVL